MEKTDAMTFIFASLPTLSCSSGQLLATYAVIPGENAPLIPPAVPVIPPMIAEIAITYIFEESARPSRAMSGRSSPIMRVRAYPMRSPSIPRARAIIMLKKTMTR
jgi:hypothetical protein